METRMDKKINTVAKVGRILATIAAVFMILGCIASAVGIGVTASLPKDAILVDVTGTADVTAKGEMLESITDAIIDSAKGGEGKVMLGDSNVAIGDVEDSIPEGVTAQKTDKGFTLSVANKRLDISTQAITTALILSLLNAVCLTVVLFMIRALMKSIEKCETPFCDEVIRKMKNFGYSLIPLAVLSGTSENAWNLLDVGVHGGIDLKVVFVILVVFMLVMIFSYGAALQKESDETL